MTYLRNVHFIDAYFGALYCSPQASMSGRPYGGVYTRRSYRKMGWNLALRPAHKTVLFPFRNGRKY